MAELESLTQVLIDASSLAPRDAQALALDDSANGVSALNAAGGDRFDELMNSLTDAMKGPDESVKNGRSPLPQNVGVLPGYDLESALPNYEHLMDLSSLVSLYTAIAKIAAREKRGHPDPYDITIASEAAHEFRDMASISYNVMVGPMAGIFNFQAGSVQTFSKKMSKTEIHLEFIAELFKGFSFTKPALLQVDAILTKFVESLGTVSLTTGSSSQTVDFTLFINQVLRINISGDEANPIWVFQPRKRVVFMHIDASTYKWATKKASHESSTFNMSYTVADCDLNVNKYLAVKSKLDQIFLKVVGRNMREFAKAICPPPVQEKGEQE